MMERRQEKIDQIRSLSQTLDTRFEGPMGFRFGLDGLIGLIPGAGDLVTTGLSLYIMIQAALLGVSSATLVRMAFNLAVENVIDMIPVLGNLFDFYWKANIKNLKLIEEHLAHPARETIR